MFVEFVGWEELIRAVVCQTTALSYIAAVEEAAVVAGPTMQSSAPQTVAQWKAVHRMERSPWFIALITLILYK